MKKILIVCPYPEGKAPSQRFRFEQYLPYLRENGLELRIASFWNADQWPGIYGGKSIGYRILSTLMAFVKRFLLLFSLPQYDTIFIHREATPIGPPWWEWCAAKGFGKRLIYDFDDAVWLPNSSDANAKIVGKLKNHGKTGKIIGWSETVFAGNEFLAIYARQFCGKVIVVPTTIDCENHHNRNKFNVNRDYVPTSKNAVGISTKTNKSEIYPVPVPTPQKQVGINSKTDKSKIYPVSPLTTPQKGGVSGSKERVTMGWTGTHSTLKQLVPLFPLLQKVYDQQPFRFLLIADIAPAAMPDFVEFRKWTKETEIADLLEIDIGIMPLYDTDWERGKCGFKALQYMALEIPAVVSKVGVNNEIVIDRETGFIAEPVTGRDEAIYPEWENALLVLLKNDQLRKLNGNKGRERIEEKYSSKVFQETYMKTLIMQT